MENRISVQTLHLPSKHYNIQLYPHLLVTAPNLQSCIFPLVLTSVGSFHFNLSGVFFKKAERLTNFHKKEVRQFPCLLLTYCLFETPEPSEVHKKNSNIQNLFLKPEVMDSDVT